MSQLFSYSTLEELAQELGLSSAAQVLQKMLKARIFPVLPLHRDWHVFVMSRFREMGFQPFKDAAIHRPDVQGIELDEDTCTQLLASPIGKAQLNSAATAWILVHESGQESAAAALSPLRRQKLPLFMQHDYQGLHQSILTEPRFTVFNLPEYTADEVQKWRFREDIKPSSGVLFKMSELRVSPEDEAKLRPSLPPPKPTPKPLPTSGQHISMQLGQLLEVFNEHRDDIQQVLARNTPSTQRELLSKKLHAALQAKDPHRWKSATLRGYAVGLIFPAPSDERRSKKHAPYTDDGMPRKLATLLENLASQLQEVRTFETGQWKDWLIAQLNVSEKEASNITTIVRLTLPRRGGRRLPVQPSAEVQQPSQPPTAPQ